MWIGESFVGSGANVAHINVFVGPRDGPVGAAQVAGMSSPSMGYIPFMAVLRPNLPAKLRLSPHPVGDVPVIEHHASNHRIFQ